MTFNTVLTFRHYMVNKNTVACHYNAVQYNIILYTALQRLVQNLTRGWTHKRHPPYLAHTGEPWGVFCEDVEENWRRYKSAVLYSKISQHLEGWFLATYSGSSSRFHRWMSGLWQAKLSAKDGSSTPLSQLEGGSFSSSPSAFWWPAQNAKSNISFLSENVAIMLMV